MSTTTLPEGWHIPLTQWFTVQLITATTVAFTSASSPLRNAAAILAFATAYSVQLSAQKYLPGTRFGAPIVAMCWINVLNAIDLLILSRASYEAQQEYNANSKSNPNPTTSKPLPHPGPGLALALALCKRYIWSLALTFNYRRINTPWQIRSLPHFNPDQPGYIPTRTRFLVTSVAKLIFSVGIVHIFTIETSDLYLNHAVSHLPTKPGEILFPFLYPSSATLGWKRDLVLRVLFTLSFGVVARATIVAGYTLFAVLFVGSGLHQPRMWPPVEGGIWNEGWCLRGFWGKSWHQTLRALLVSNADFLSSSLHIPIPLRTPFRFIFCFFVSGIIHLLMDVGFGVSIPESGALWFFSLQVLGVLVEVSVGRVLGKGLGDVGMWVKKGVGFVWVGAFMLWSVPVWVNPILVRLFADGVRMMSPFLGFGGWVI
ncbi:hypothetical protein BO94DRAFT_625910 [Aspergillus sclerotioniger CBS 115572]|uniref:Wax synthase domain-containing protein n=1 Tax=Aspergillus sclerotioniger CBS 115572 TaxID=1450535 RepID=A0A317W6A4_9EURO|nr:hypothetical protein BO94DRAFT_625910 [Aspergillus sclerotioniger CBS 115572]PWY80767.1 hypothetical protein BO94DRAFT_625910 [Aspergillus sclerotioniger CBS 115572]